MGDDDNAARPHPPPHPPSLADAQQARFAGYALVGGRACTPSQSPEIARSFARLVIRPRQAGRAAPTKLDLYHRAVEDGHLPSPP